jgi:hypothetical protein
MTQRVVNYTYGTGNPVLPDGSIDVRDGIDNLQSLDIFMNAGEDTYNQRDGEIVQTVAGAIRSTGFKPGTGDFTTGFTVLPGQYNISWYDPVSKNWYSYLGIIPSPSGHPVAPGTNPVGSVDWAPRTDYLLRSELAASGGAGLVGTSGGVTVQDTLNSLTALYIGQQSSQVTITVGASGDFSTINAAISSISKSQHVITAGNGGVRIELLSGFVLNEQVIVDFINLSYVEIFSASTISINRTALVADVGGYLPAFCARNSAALPIINASFDMGWTAGSQDKSVAFLAYGAGSSVAILPGKGCIRCYGFGILASNSATFNADGTIWDGCAGDGVSVYSGATGSAKLARADSCYNGFVANGGTLDATSSQARQTRSAGHVARKSGVLNAEFADAQNGLVYGFYAAISSNLNVTRGNCSGCRFGISAQRTAKVSAEEVIADNCKETNISARRYAEIEAQSCHAVNTTTTPLYCIRANYSGSVIVESGVIGGTCTDNICRATTNAEIQATDAVMSGATGTSIAVYVDESSNFNGRRMSVDHTMSAGTVVQVLRGSAADITGSTIVGGGNYGVVSQYCANISADNAEIHGSSSYSVYATDGGKMSITNANVRRNVALDQNTDIVISRGGIISAFGAVGGVNTTVNAVSASGIIFR